MQNDFQNKKNNQYLEQVQEPYYTDTINEQINTNRALNFQKNNKIDVTQQQQSLDFQNKNDNTDMSNFTQIQLLQQSNLQNNNQQQQDTNNNTILQGQNQIDIKKQYETKNSNISLQKYSNQGNKYNSSLKDNFSSQNLQQTSQKYIKNQPSQLQNSNSKLNKNSNIESKILKSKKSYKDDLKNITKKIKISQMLSGKNSKNYNKKNKFFSQQNQNNPALGIRDILLVNNDFKQKFQFAKLRKIFKTLLEDTEIRRFKSLKSTHFKQLNDLTHFSIKKAKSSIITRIVSQAFRKIKKLLLVDKIYEPESNIAFLYDSIAALFIMFWMFIYSMHLFFLSTDFITNNYIQILLYISNLFFISEFIMRFHIGFYENGKLVTDTSAIFNRYYQSSMLTDIIGFLAQIYNLINNSLNIWTIMFELLFFLKYKSLQNTTDRVELNLYLKGGSTHLIELLKLLFQLIIMGHCIACMWHILAHFEKTYLGYSKTWIDVYDIQDENWMVRYNEAFYWSIATIMLVGSKGETPYEIVFTTITLLWTVCIFAYLISKISMIIEEINKTQQLFKQDLEVINKYMDQKELDHNLQSKVRSCLEYIYQASDVTNIKMKAQSVIAGFPKSLQEQVRLKSNQVIINKFKFIFQHFSPQTQQNLLSIMSEHEFQTNEYIFDQDKQYKELSLFLVLRGKVELVQHHGKKQPDDLNLVLANIQQQDKLGDLNFLIGNSYEYSAKCQSFVTVCKISRTDFLAIIQKDKEDYERFMMIKDEIIFQNNSKYYDRKCFICNRVTHKEDKCNLLSYQPNRYILSMKNSKRYSFQQRDQKFKRKKITDNKINALKKDLIINLEYLKYDLKEDPEIKEFLKQYYDYSTTNSDEDYYSQDEDDEFSKSGSEDENSNYQNNTSRQILNRQDKDQNNDQLITDSNDIEYKDSQQYLQTDRSSKNILKLSPKKQQKPRKSKLYMQSLRDNAKNNEQLSIKQMQNSSSKSPTELTKSLRHMPKSRSNSTSRMHKSHQSDRYLKQQNSRNETKKLSYFGNSQNQNQSDFNFDFRKEQFIHLMDKHDSTHKINQKNEENSDLQQFPSKNSNFKYSNNNIKNNNYQTCEDIDSCMNENYQKNTSPNVSIILQNSNQNTARMTKPMNCKFMNVLSKTQDLSNKNSQNLAQYNQIQNNNDQGNFNQDYIILNVPENSQRNLQTQQSNLQGSYQDICNEQGYMDDSCNFTNKPKYNNNFNISNFDKYKRKQVLNQQDLTEQLEKSSQIVQDFFDQGVKPKKKINKLKSVIQGSHFKSIQKQNIQETKKNKKQLLFNMVTTLLKEEKEENLIKTNKTLLKNNQNQRPSKIIKSQINNNNIKRNSLDRKRSIMVALKAKNNFLSQINQQNANSTINENNYVQNQQQNHQQNRKQSIKLQEIIKRQSIHNNDKQEGKNGYFMKLFQQISQDQDEIPQQEQDQIESTEQRSVVQKNSQSLQYTEEQLKNRYSIKDIIVMEQAESFIRQKLLDQQFFEFDQQYNWHLYLPQHNLTSILRNFKYNQYKIINKGLETNNQRNKKKSKKTFFQKMQGDNSSVRIKSKEFTNFSQKSPNKSLMKQQSQYTTNNYSK